MSISFGVIAQKSDLIAEYLNSNKEAYVQVKVSDHKTIQEINNVITAEEVDENHVAVFVTKNNLQKFLNLNLDYQILTPPSKLYKYEMYDGSKGVYEWDSYPTYEEYINIMEQFAADYPEICEVFSIGETNEGRELKFVKISDNISENEAEPRFLYTGTMHGDETTGFVILLRLIDYLTSNYGIDEEVTEMVNNLEIWINPAANPDGTYAGGNNTVYGATRTNADGVDLNRNYPDAEDGPHPDGNEWQTETIAFMDMAEEYDFVMSANTHGGVEVVNYPWDTWYSLHPDDEWWYFVSREFADTAHVFSPSGYMTFMDDGITNGAAWYSISGGRQDYMNYFHNCREFTLEISDVKTVPESQLDDHWTYLKRSFINYIKQSYYGVRGIVTDSLTSEPIDAKVEILDHDFQNSFVYSAADFGDYYRYLKEGTYDITFSKEGYLPKTIEDVSVVDYETTILDVQLVSANLISDFSADMNSIAIGSQVQFSEQCFGEIDSYEWIFEGGSPATSSDANPVVSYNEAGSFDVSLTIYSGSDSQTLTKEDFIRVSEEYVITDGEITTCSGMFLDDGGLDGNYTNSQDFVYTIYGETDITEAILTVDFEEFSVESEASCNYDYLEIYNGVGTSVELIGTYCGTDSPGMVEANNEDNALTFVFHSDGSVNQSGWRANINCTIIDHVNGLEHQNISIYPNPNNSHLLFVSTEDVVHEISIYTLSGQQLVTWKQNTGNQYQLPESIVKGVYLLNVLTEKGLYVEKLIIE